MAAQMQQRAVVKSLPDEPNLTITLTVGGRQRNLDRPKTEPLEKPLTRIQKASAPAPDKRKKQKQNGGAEPAGAIQTSTGNNSSSGPPFIGLYTGPTAEHPLVDALGTTNEDAWQHGRLLLVGDTSYLVICNPPSVERVLTHGTAFIGIPIVPSVQQLHFAAVGDCKWQWWRRPRGVSFNDESAWQVISGATERGYTPVVEDEGCRLRVVCTPTRSSCSGTYIETESSGGGGEVNSVDQEVIIGDSVYTEIGPVAVPPSPDATSGRKHLTSSYVLPPVLRVVSYNLLADQYAATDSAKNVLFASCPSECLEPSYRRPLILGEILQYNADVACLQEVDDMMFMLCLEPALSEAGFEGVYTNKAGQVREGSAAFWRQDRYTLAARRDITLKSLFPATSDPAAIAAAKYGPAFEAMLSSSPALCHALQRVATIAQILILAPKHPDLRPLCLVNTHLFFHYAAPHIRTMHVYAILQEAAAAVADVAQNPALFEACGGRTPSLLFCGDLNSDLNDGIPGAIELLFRGEVPLDHWDWAFGVDFKWERGEEGQEGQEQGDGQEEQGDGNTTEGEVEKMIHTEIEHLRPGSPRKPEDIIPGVELKSPFTLAAVDELRTECTNYVKGYQGLLDYVWYDRGAMEVVQVVPVPGVNELEGYIPSRRFPSDHLAVVADLKFRPDDAPPPAPLAPQGDAAVGSAIIPALLSNVGIAAAALKRGALLVVPTDTLYGLAACATDATAVDRIYQAKRRAEHKPVAVCVADPEDLGRYVEVEHLPKGLLEDLLPGPVTLLLPRRPDAPLAASLNPGVNALGVRIPCSQFLRAVCRQHRGALALTSANLSGQQSPLSVQEIEEVRPACDAVFDAGTVSEARAGSTIVDLTKKGEFTVTRRGAALEQTLAVLQGKHGLKQAVAGAVGEDSGSE